MQIVIFKCGQLELERSNDYLYCNIGSRLIKKTIYIYNILVWFYSLKYIAFGMFTLVNLTEKFFLKSHDQSFRIDFMYSNFNNFVLNSMITPLLFLS